MRQDRDVSPLKRVLSEELEQIKTYNRECECFHQYISEKNWPALEGQIVKMRGLSESISQLDLQRDNLLSGLKIHFNLDKSCDFVQLLSQLSLEDQKELKQLRQELKRVFKLLTIRLEGIDKIVEERKLFLKGIIEEVVPERKEKIYTRQGFRRSVEPKPLLINTHF